MNRSSPSGEPAKCKSLASSLSGGRRRTTFSASAARRPGTAISSNLRIEERVLEQQQRDLCQHQLPLSGLARGTPGGAPSRAWQTSPRLSSCRCAALCARSDLAPFQLHRPLLGGRRGHSAHSNAGRSRNLASQRGEGEAGTGAAGDDSPVPPASPGPVAAGAPRAARSRVAGVGVGATIRGTSAVPVTPISGCGCRPTRCPTSHTSSASSTNASSQLQRGARVGWLANSRPAGGA